MPRRLMSLKTRRMSSATFESRFPVGSSASRMKGSLTSARAIATRCCSPPESWDGRWSALSESPTAASVRNTLGWICKAEAPVTSSAKATFSRAVRFLSSRKSGTRCRAGGAAPDLPRADLVEAYPETRTIPRVGRSSIVTSLTNVVLPAPEGPVTKVNSPFRMWNETSFRAEPCAGTPCGRPGTGSCAGRGGHAVRSPGARSPAPPGCRRRPDPRAGDEGLLGPLLLELTRSRGAMSSNSTSSPPPAPRDTITCSRSGSRARSRVPDRGPASPPRRPAAAGAAELDHRRRGRVPGISIACRLSTSAPR